MRTRTLAHARQGRRSAWRATIRVSKRSSPRSGQPPPTPGRRSGSTGPLASGCSWIRNRRASRSTKRRLAGPVKLAGVDRSRQSAQQRRDARARHRRPRSRSAIWPVRPLDTGELTGLLEEYADVRANRAHDGARRPRPAIAVASSSRQTRRSASASRRFRRWATASPQPHCRRMLPASATADSLAHHQISDRVARGRTRPRSRAAAQTSVAARARSPA